MKRKVRTRLSQLEMAQIVMRGNLKHHFDDEAITEPVDHGGQTSFDGLYAIEQDLDDLLNKSQNAPPHGEADGSIDQERYRLLRYTYNTIRELKQALDAWEKLD